MHSDAFSHTTSDEVWRSDGHTFRRHLRASDSRAAKTEQASATSDPTCPFVARSREPFHRRRSDKRLCHLVWAWLRFQEQAGTRTNVFTAQRNRELSHYVAEACRGEIAESFCIEEARLKPRDLPRGGVAWQPSAALKPSWPSQRTAKFQGARLTGRRASRKLLCVIRLHRPVAGHFQSKYSAPRAGPPPGNGRQPFVAAYHHTLACAQHALFQRHTKQNPNFFASHTFRFFLQAK